jgi:hypothetical protein
VGWHLVGSRELSFAKTSDPDGVGADLPRVVLDAQHGKIPAPLCAEVEHSKDTASLWDLVQKGNVFRFGLWRESLKRCGPIVQLAPPECGFLKRGATAAPKQDKGYRSEASE